MHEGPSIADVSLPWFVEDILPPTLQSLDNFQNCGRQNSSKMLGWDDFYKPGQWYICNTWVRKAKQVTWNEYEIWNACNLFGSYFHIVCQVQLELTAWHRTMTGSNISATVCSWKESRPILEIRATTYQKIRKKRKTGNISKFALVFHLPLTCRPNSIWSLLLRDRSKGRVPSWFKSRGYLENNGLSHLSTTNCSVSGVQRWALRMPNLALHLKFHNLFTS